MFWLMKYDNFNSAMKPTNNNINIDACSGTENKQTSCVDLNMISGKLTPASNTEIPFGHNIEYIYFYNSKWRYSP